MKKILYELLESLGYEVYEQGSFTSEHDYPSHFFTVWNYECPIEKYYSNKPNRCTWKFWINFYSTDPLKPEEVLENVRNLLSENGWIVPTKGQDIASGSKIHSGRELNVFYIEKL